MKLNKVIFISLSLFLIKCKGAGEEPDKEVVWTKESSVNLNKDFALEEEIQIKFFLEQHENWVPIKTGSGLQIIELKKGQGEKAKDGALAQTKFKIKLLDGTLAYQTEEDEVKEFVINHSEVESGVQEGITSMRVGGRSVFIIPSHLAHGLVGDFAKIPPLSPIVVDVELLDLIFKKENK
jgi:FKBP-type peptidyl-prolyl cis-trans isomerase FkpA